MPVLPNPAILDGTLEATFWDKAFSACYSITTVDFLSIDKAFTRASTILTALKASGMCASSLAELEIWSREKQFTAISLDVVIATLPSHLRPGYLALSYDPDYHLTLLCYRLSSLGSDFERVVVRASLASELVLELDSEWWSFIELKVSRSFEIVAYRAF